MRTMAWRLHQHLDRTFNTLLCPLVSTRTGTGTQPPDAFDFHFQNLVFGIPIRGASDLGFVGVQKPIYNAERANLTARCRAVPEPAYNAMPRARIRFRVHSGAVEVLVQQSSSNTVLPSVPVGTCACGCCSYRYFCGRGTCTCLAAESSTFSPLPHIFPSSETRCGR